jgi:hypothetical protein
MGPKPKNFTDKNWLVEHGFRGRFPTSYVVASPNPCPTTYRGFLAPLTCPPKTDPHVKLEWSTEYFSKVSGNPVLIKRRGKAEEMIQPNWLCDITKAVSLLDFEPQIFLALGAKLTSYRHRKENWL